MDLSSIANNINYRYQQGSRRIQIGGAVSGLDTNAIIEKLIEVESIPLQRLNEKFLQNANLQKAYQKVSDRIREFYNYVSDFGRQANLIPKTATVSNNVLGATATASARDGVYQINVQSIATNSTFAGSQFAKAIDLNSTFAEIDSRYPPVAGTVRLTIGSASTEVTIDATDTVSAIVAKLSNAFSDLGANANVSFSNGRLSIDSDRAFRLSNVSGNFTFVMRLNDAFLRTSGGRYVLESSGHVGAYSSLRRIEDLGISGNRELRINGTTVAIARTDTIAQVVSKINQNVQSVTASYDDRNGVIRLVSKNTGDELITVEAPTGSEDLLNALGLSTGTFTLGNVARVTVTLDGVSETVESRTNSFNYSGLALTLNSVGSATVNVKTDNDKVVERVRDFVNKWNELMDFLHGKLTENKVRGKKEDDMSEEEKLQGLLKGDSFLRRIFERFRNFVYTTVDGTSLRDLGITSGDAGREFQNTMRGKLSLNEDRLRNFIERNGAEAVWRFFGDPQARGLAVRLKDFSWDLVKFNGEIDTVAGMNGRLEREKRILSKRMVAMFQYIEKKEQMLWAKYSALESALAKLTAQGNFMAGAIAQGQRK